MNMNQHSGVMQNQFNNMMPQNPQQPMYNQPMFQQGMVNNNVVNVPLQQQQLSQQHMLQQQQMQRGAMPRGSPIQHMAQAKNMPLNGSNMPNHMNSVPNGTQPNQFMMVNNAPMQNGANSQGHTPQMRHQSQPFMPMQTPMKGMNMETQRAASMEKKKAAKGPAKPAQPVPTSGQNTPAMPSGSAGVAGPSVPGPAPASAPSAPSAPPAQGYPYKMEPEMQSDMNARMVKRHFGNSGVMRILDLIEQVSSEQPETLASVEYWQRVVSAYFLPNSVVRFTTAPTPPAEPKEKDDDEAMVYNLHNTPPNDAARQFELTPATAPRFLAANFQGDGMARCTVTLPGIKFQVLNNGCIFVISRLSMYSRYSDGSMATLSGNVKLLMNRDLRIDWIDCHCLHYEGGIAFGDLTRRWKAFKETGGAEEFLASLYESDALRNAASSGIGENAMRLLKVSDIMAHLRQLMGFSMVNNIGSPARAMELYMSQERSNAPERSEGA